VVTVERRARFVTVALALALAWVAIGVTVGPLAAADHPAARHRLAGRLQTRVLPGVPGEVLAGRYEVFEDRRAGNGRKIPLDIVVLPARNARPEPEPLVFLAGGDLPPATQWAPFLARGLEKLRNERDILLVDSRGTGASHRLDCQLPDPFLDPALATDPGAWQRAVKRCRDELAAGADLRLYTTPLAMDDLFEVCEWLGWSKIDLWGVSYGTKAARVFVRQHPGHVRTMVLSGVLPLAPTTWKERAASAQRGLDRVVTDCERDSSCAKSFPNLHDEVDSLLARVAQSSFRSMKPGYATGSIRRYPTPSRVPNFRTCCMQPTLVIGSRSGVGFESATTRCRTVPRRA
jgi:pimeloyl-ACP methyl ester carboxylesterase